MTAGTISSAAFGDTTSCFTIMATARSPMSLATPASTTNKSDGEPDVPGSTTTATATLIFSSDRKSTRLNSSHGYISYAVFCLKKKKTYSDIDSSDTAYT